MSIKYLVKLKMLLLCVSFFLLFFSCKTENAEKNTGGIILNFSADAILIDADMGDDIDSISKEQALNALNNFVDKYANTQVTSMFYNVNYQRACYDSEVMEAYWDVENPEQQVTDWPRMFWKIHKKGIDPFEVCIKRSRQKNISPWISIRMNDHHYFDDSTRINKLWQNHPEYRLSQNAMFNYAKEEVRDYYYSFIKEALEKYDVDGVELDWMRTNTLFVKGEEEQGILLINQFMRDIRELTQQLSIEKGHPVQVAVRIPSTPEIGKSFGLDGVTWAKEGLTDILIPSNWFVPTNFDIPVELWKDEVGDEADCIIAPGADFAHCFAKNKTVKQVSSNIETMRGFSASAFSRGADAIYIFNHFLSDYKVKVVDPDGTIHYTEEKQKAINEIGELSTSLGKPRIHVVSYHDPDINPIRQEPLILLKDTVNRFSIYTGPKPKGKFVIRIGLELMEGVKDADLFVELNGMKCKFIEDMPRDTSYVYDNTKVWHVVSTAAETGARVLQFEADLQTVKEGYNQIAVMNTKSENQAITWLEVQID